MSYTDETIESAIRNAKHGSSREPLAWAASEYLKAKPVIECYSTSFEGAIGAKAREYLNTLNKS